MATAALASTPSIISLAESVTGWNGAPDTLEPDIKVEGSNSIAGAMTTNGNNDCYYTGFTAADMSAVHLRLWFNISFVGNLAATNQIQVSISDGTNTAYWTIKDPGSYAGGWAQAVIYTGNTPTSGTKPTGNTTQVGMRFVTASKPRNVPANCWFDAWYYGDGYTVTGGTSGDPIDWSHIASVDKTNAYGIVTEIDGVYFMAGEITIGDGALTTYFEPTAQLVQFRDLPVLSTLYQVVFFDDASLLTNVAITGGAWSAAGTQTYTLDASVVCNDFTLDGTQISKLDAGSFHAGAEVKNTVFNNCLQVDPSTSDFHDNTFSNSVDTTGAMLFPSDSTNIYNIDFINCDNGVEYASTSDATPTFTNFTFDDVSGNYDVYSTDGAITIVISGGGNANSYNTAGGVVTFSNPKQFKFTVKPSIIDYEWRIYSVTALGSLAGATELDGEETATADNQTYDYTYSSDTPIAVQIISQPDEDYEEAVEYYTLVSTNQDVIINLEKDNNN